MTIPHFLILVDHKRAAAAYAKALSEMTLMLPELNEAAEKLDKIKRESYEQDKKEYEEAKKRFERFITYPSCPNYQVNALWGDRQLLKKKSIIASAAKADFYLEQDEVVEMVAMENGTWLANWRLLLGLKVSEDMKQLMWNVVPQSFMRQI